MSTETIITRWTPVAIIALLAGCAQDPHVAVAAAQNGLAASGDIAVAYMSRPVCSATSGPICSDPAIKAQIKIAFDKAADDVNAAQAVADAGGTPDLTATTAALTALQSLLTTVK